ncbi:hypothetical protein GT037_007606, partial [Alternaria burnsii]
ALEVFVILIKHFSIRVEQHSRTHVNHRKTVVYWAQSWVGLSSPSIICYFP